MTVPQHDTTTLVVLGLVALQPGSGYDLARLAERSVGYLWAPSRSQIYKVLPRLVAHRLAIAKTVRQRDRPDKASTQSRRPVDVRSDAGSRRSRKNRPAAPTSSH